MNWRNAVSELSSRGRFQSFYKNVKLDCGYRLDIVVDNSVIVEVKAVEKLNSVHEAQLLSYLRLYGARLGLLINFHVGMLKHGIKRVVNEFPDSAISANSAVKLL